MPCVCFLSFVLQLLLCVAVFGITLHAWNSGAEQAKKLRDFGVFMFDFPLEIHSIVSSLLWFRLWRQMIWILCVIASHSVSSLPLSPPKLYLILASFGWLLFHCRFPTTNHVIVCLLHSVVCLYVDWRKISTSRYCDAVTSEHPSNRAYFM